MDADVLIIGAGPAGLVATDEPIRAGEDAGFGGKGAHGDNALEGTFPGGCIFSGRTAGRSLAALL